MIKYLLFLSLFLAISHAGFDFRSLIRCSTSSCGGIAGITCCPNYSCQLDGRYADAAGTCLENTPENCDGKSCGGYTRVPSVCCPGYECIKTNPLIPDLPGKCKKSAALVGQGCVPAGGICGGFVGTECCSGGCPYKPGADFGYC